MSFLQGNITELSDLIIKLDAKMVFDKENVTEEEKLAFNYLKDLKSIYNVLAPDKKNKSKVACVLYNHPTKMPEGYGFNYWNDKYKELETQIITQLLHHEITEIWVDMTQGISICTARAVKRMKTAGMQIKLNAIIPYKNQSKEIYGASRELYNNLLSFVDETICFEDNNKTKETLKNTINLMYEKTDTIILTSENKQYLNFFVELATSQNKSIITIDL